MLTVAAPPVDIVFPTLPMALDPEYVAKAFATALRAKGQVFDRLECVVERSRIKRGRKALLGYRLVGQTCDGTPVDQRAMLALYPGGNPDLLPDVLGTTRQLSAQSLSVSLPVPQLGGEAWFFPNDRKVHGIAAMLAEREGLLEVMHYVPEQGCTVRLVEPSGRVLYGKCRADDRGAVAAQLGADQFDGTGSLRLARIVAHNPESRVVWQEEIAGMPLDPATVLAEPQLWAERIAAALRDLHALQPPASLKRLSFESASETIFKRVERTCAAMPEFAKRLTALAQALFQNRPPETTPVPSHCDLHPGNLLWDGATFGVIDLDTAASAPRTFDHATLAAALTHKAIERGSNEAALTTMVHALRKGAEKDEVDPSAFDWSFAASLVGERLYRCGTRLKSPSPSVRSRLLLQAEQIVQHYA